MPLNKDVTTWDVKDLISVNEALDDGSLLQVVERVFLPWEEDIAGKSWRRLSLGRQPGAQVFFDGKKVHVDLNPKYAIAKPVSKVLVQTDVEVDLEEGVRLADRICRFAGITLTERGPNGEVFGEDPVDVATRDWVRATQRLMTTIGKDGAAKKLEETAKILRSKG